MSFQKHLNDARLRLLFPTQDSCNDGILSRYCMDVIDELVIRRQNTLEPSLIAFGALTATPGQTHYVLDSIAPGFGKARYLYTKNVSNDPAYQRGWVPIVGMDDLTEQYRGGDNLNQITNLPILPLAATIYYDRDRGNVLELAPIPQQTIAFDFAYEPSTNRPTTKTGAGFTLPQFDSLVAAKLALKAVIHCQWRGLSKAEARERRDEIRQSLLYEIGSPEERRGLDYLFWQFSLTTSNTTSSVTRGFGQGKWW